MRTVALGAAVDEGGHIFFSNMNATLGEFNGKIVKQRRGARRGHIRVVQQIAIAAESRARSPGLTVANQYEVAKTGPDIVDAI